MRKVGGKGVAGQKRAVGRTLSLVFYSMKTEWNFGKNSLLSSFLSFSLSSLSIS